ncbi:MAG: hypothetical protein M0R17_03370 [Candidatus Omnitrophica bacterium]|jgi:hypothetical protein|nr:hypothetical protein [Candidatus Omnitrophota bacterium]
MLSKTELINLFNSNQTKRYAKSGKFIYRKALPNELIVSVLDNKIETTNISNNEFNCVIQNITVNGKNETYLITEKVFNNRYINTKAQITYNNNIWLIVIPKGETDAFEYIGESITFLAPWNEEMICNFGDYICKVPDTVDDIYRIEKDTFNLTYKLKE